MRSNQGRAEIDAMLIAGELPRVPASREHADELIDLATQRLGTARDAREADPEGAYAIGYDAGRKALAAVLVDLGEPRSARTRPQRRTIRPTHAVGVTRPVS